MNRDEAIMVVDDIEINGLGSINYLTDLYQEVHEIHITLDDEDDTRELKDPNFRKSIIETLRKGWAKPYFSFFKVITMEDRVVFPEIEDGLEELLLDEELRMKNLVGCFKKLEPAIARASNYEHEHDCDVAIVLIHYYQI